MIRRMMMMMVMLMVGMGMLAMGQAAAPAGGAGERLDAAKLLSPYVDGQTLLVAHVDVSKIDTGAIAKYVTDLFDEAKVPAESGIRQNLAAGRLAADTFLARFKMLGGRYVFLLLSHPDIWPNMQPLAVLIKVEPVDVTAVDMETFIKSVIPGGGGGGPGDLVTAKMPDGLIFVGNAAALERLKGMKAEPRPDLSLEALGQSAAALDVFAAPSPDVRRALSELMPTLPAEVGGGSTGGLLKGFKSVRLVVAMPPEPGASLTFTFLQGTGGGAGGNGEGMAAAQGVVEIVTKVRDLLLADTGLAQQLESPELKPYAGEIRTLIKEVLTPTGPGIGGMGGATMLGPWTLQLSSKQVQTVAHLLMPAVASARGKAEQMRSMSNIKELVVACVVYANEHNGTLPESLKVLLDAKAIPEQALVNPWDPKRRGYVYRRWAADINKIPNASTAPLVWEAAVDNEEGVNVGFLDGHVELVRDKRVFAEMMARMEDWVKTVK